MCSRTHAATQSLQLQLETLAKKGATALERFEAYTTEPTRAVFEMAEVTRALSALPAVTNQVLFLREQIEMRSLGVGWSDLSTTISAGKDESQEQLVRRLKGHLKHVLVEEKARLRNGFEMPAEAPMPDFERKSEKQLGTPTADAQELARRSLMSPEQIRAASQRERERREAAGFTDGVQMVMPREAPPLDNSLVGTQLEARCARRTHRSGDAATLSQPAALTAAAGLLGHVQVDGGRLEREDVVSLRGQAHRRWRDRQGPRRRVLHRTGASAGSESRDRLLLLLLTPVAWIRGVCGRRRSSRQEAWRSSSGRRTRSAASQSRRSCGCS